MRMECRMTWMWMMMMMMDGGSKNPSLMKMASRL